MARARHRRLAPCAIATEVVLAGGASIWGVIFEICVSTVTAVPDVHDPRVGEELGRKDAKGQGNEV